ncbi:MAG: 2OG-Fe(II) oxygenase [Armatimonadetes bacterium]|nr:2OG-Fe(II) oxygenase [Armatimonadota bacterium]
MIRQSTPLDHDIWTVSGVLSEAECRELIERAEAQGFEAAAVRMSGGPQILTGVRNNDRLVYDDPDLARTLWERIREFVPPEIEGRQAAGLFQPFRFYRYDPGQRFKRHKDGRETLPTGEQSRITFLVYLNADYEGGETIFSDATFQDGKRLSREIRVVPEVGMGLFFIHERWHEGAPVTRGRKYVLRSDILFHPA